MLVLSPFIRQHDRLCRIEMGKKQIFVFKVNLATLVEPVLSSMTVLFRSPLVCNPVHRSFQTAESKAKGLVSILD